MRLVDGEWRDNAAVVRSHPRAESVENSYVSSVETVVPVIRQVRGLSETLGFVVNTTRAD